MDSGWAALLGAIVGSGGTIAAAWVGELVKGQRERKLDKIRKKRLEQLMSDPAYIWRSMQTLCDSIGASQEKTAGLLLEIGARRSLENGKDYWALVTRAPFPDAQ